MAAGHVWGIDIGQCGLKALRGTYTNDGVTVDSFDYIEYPQILSQPDANPDQLIREALKTFLSRNNLRGDKVALSLPGQAGLARFIKLPPVDAKQLPNLVGFEAKQQIPFALEDVVWDYQRIPGTQGTAEYIAADDDDDDDDDELDLDEVPMETEVGLFAIKRDQVLRSIRPLMDAEVELDYIQLAPIAAYNAMAFDQVRCDEGLDSEKADNWIAVLSMGTDSSDLVITNGFRLWQRSVPIGGSHFTKQLTTDLKLTYAKAEHVKRNAREAKDAKQIFKAMRPVFNDLATEIQRSVGYFGSLERSADIQKTILLGNAAKLPGLPQFLEKNLGMPAIKLSDYARLSGPATDDATYTDNSLSYAVCYGLILQGLGKGQMNTNLVPPELIRARLIRRKKPWAAAIAASLLLACAFNFFFNYRAWFSVNPDRTVKNVSWDQAASKVSTVTSSHTNYSSADSAKVEQLATMNELGEAIVGMDDGRKLWLELLKTITESLPYDKARPPGQLMSIKEYPFEQRKEIYIDSIETQYYADLSTWNTENVQARYEEFLKERQQDAEEEARAARAAQPASEDGEDADTEEDVEVELPEREEIPIEGSGWVIEIQGHHFQTKTDPKKKRYLRKTLLENLENGTVEVPGPDGQMLTFTSKEMGILSPVIVKGYMDYTFKIQNPDYEPPETVPGIAQQPGASPAPANPFAPSPQTPAAEQEDPDNPKEFNPERYKFTVQFCWKQFKLRERIKAKQKKLAEAAEEEL